MFFLNRFKQPFLLIPDIVCTIFGIVLSKNRQATAVEVENPSIFIRLCTGF